MTKKRIIPVRKYNTAENYKQKQCLCKILYIIIIL